MQRNNLGDASHYKVPVLPSRLTQAVTAALETIQEESGKSGNIHRGSDEYPQEKKVEALTHDRIEETLNPEDTFTKRMRIQCEAMMYMIGSDKKKEDLNQSIMKWIDKYSLRFSILWDQSIENGRQDALSIVEILWSEDRISVQEQLMKRMIFVSQGQKINTEMVLTWLAHYENLFMELWNTGDHDIDSIQQKLQEMSGLLSSGDDLIH